MARSIIKNKSITKKKKIVKNEQRVWMCIVCKNYKISIHNPISCPCSHNGNFVIAGNLIVEK